MSDASPGHPTTVDTTSDAMFDVVVVGGGAAGTLVAIQLLLRGGKGLRVAVVEPDARLARGAAYATGQPEHLLNVVASRMSALDGDPGHFVRFLVADGQGDEAALADVFARRRDYGRYLRHTLESLPGFPQLVHVHARAVDLERGDDFDALRLDTGATLRARQVVLAVGNAPRRMPDYLSHAGIRIAEAWDYDAVRGIPADAEVCILGSGLSMVDAALTLAHGAHRGRIHVLSRHGLMPLPHAAKGPQHEGGVADLLSQGVRARWRLLRMRIDAAIARGEPWQWSFDRLRHHGQALWQSLDERERRRFLRHAVRYWDIHRHRIAPPVAAELERLRESGQMRVVAGRLCSITADPAGGSCVHFRPRHGTREHMLHADWIVNATGVETNIDLRTGDLLAALRQRGLVLPGPLGIGIASEGIGHVVGGRGRPDPRLFVIGALRIGNLWESIAIPELREQACAIADAVSCTAPSDGRG